jgi:hypothetical protein
MNGTANNAGKPFKTGVEEGCSIRPEPCSLSSTGHLRRPPSRELLGLLGRFKGINRCGADIACLCPPLDGPAQIATLAACEILLYYLNLAGMSLARS